MKVSWAVILSALSLLSVGAVNCPEDERCHCYEEIPGVHKIECTGTNATSLEVLVNKNENVVIECGIDKPPIWIEFLHNSSLEIGEVRNLVFSFCRAPDWDGGHGERVARLLGITKLDVIRFRYLQSPLSSRELAPYPSLRRIFLSDNNVRNLSKEFLSYTPNVELLDLRSTKIGLTRDMFENSGSLMQLELGDNQIPEVEVGTFDNLKNLKLLNLWRNNLSQLESGIFRGLTSLTTLDLHENNLQMLPEDIFENLVNLRILNLNSNNFTELPQGLFRRTPNLKIMKLLYNKQNLTTLPSRLFSNLKHFQLLTLTKIGLLTVPEDLFVNSTLEHLTIDRNFIATLPSKFFKDLKDLISLNLAFNDLKSLHNGQFKNLKLLERLDLSKNHLTILKDRTFAGLESLAWLNLENNDLTSIHSNAFSHLKSLKIAKFSRNKLTLKSGLFSSVGLGPISPFQYCLNLEELYLSYNNVSEMFSDWVIGRTKLRVLDLKGNYFQELEAADLQFLSPTIKVDLSHNNISRIELTRLELIAMNQTEPRDVVVDIRGNPIECDCDIYDFIRYINGEMHPYAQNYVHIKRDEVFCSDDVPIAALSSKSLKCRHEADQSSSVAMEDPCAPDGICECWFRPHDQALILDCAGKNLTQAPVAIDAKNATRVEIYLQSNWLEECPDMSDPGYSKVEVLDVSSNRISTLDSRILSSNLRVLNLNKNNLSHVDTEILNFWSNSSNIAKLSLQDNPWSCDCSSLDLLEFIQTNFVSIPELRDVTCPGTNRTFTAMSIDELCPSWSTLTITLSSIVSIFCLLALVVIVFYFRNQQQIKVWLYSKNLCMWWVSEEEVDKDKQYDAFISYSHKDEAFVVKELVGTLEDGPDPYKLCIHIRDWLAGEWITTQITNSVRESRRTIIVLSQNFIHSEWGRMEFQAAHKQALSEKMNRVIVIIYGDVGSTVDMYPELKSYLETNTYITWGEPYFWQKLRYAMPHKVQRSARNKQPMKIQNMSLASEKSSEK